MFSLLTLFVKSMKRISTPQVLLTRSILALCYIKMVTSKQNFDPYPPKKTLRKLLFRGATGSITALIWFSAIKLLPLSEATVLQKTSPLWTSIATVFIMKSEKYEKRLFVFIFTGMLGIILIFKPPSLLSLFGILNSATTTDDALMHAIGAGMSLLSALLMTIT
jgi:drug/metabolite transporter (DMT)-like permease